MKSVQLVLEPVLPEVVGPLRTDQTYDVAAEVSVCYSTHGILYAGRGLLRRTGSPGTGGIGKACVKYRRLRTPLLKRFALNSEGILSGRRELSEFVKRRFCYAKTSQEPCSFNGNFLIIDKDQFPNQVFSLVGHSLREGNRTKWSSSSPTTRLEAAVEKTCGENAVETSIFRSPGLPTLPE